MSVNALTNQFKSMRLNKPKPNGVGNKTARTVGRTIGTAIRGGRTVANLSVAAVKKTKMMYQKSVVLLKDFERMTNTKIVVPVVEGADYALLILQILFILTTVVGIITFYKTKTDLWVYTDEGHVNIIRRCLTLIKYINDFNMKVGSIFPMAFGTVYTTITTTGAIAGKKIWANPNKLRDLNKLFNGNNLESIKQAALTGLISNMARAQMPFGIGNGAAYRTVRGLSKSATGALNFVSSKIGSDPVTSARALRQLKLNMPNMMLPFERDFNRFIKELVNTTMSSAITLSIAAGYRAPKTYRKIAARRSAKTIKPRSSNKQ